MNLLVRACTLVNPLCIWESLLLCAGKCVWMYARGRTEEAKQRKKEKEKQAEKYPSTYFRFDCKSIRWFHATPCMYDWWCVRGRHTCSHHPSKQPMIYAKVRDPTLDCHRWWCVMLCCVAWRALRKCIRAHIDYITRMWFIEILLANEKKYIHLCRIHLFIFICI